MKTTIKTPPPIVKKPVSRFKKGLIISGSVFSLLLLILVIYLTTKKVLSVVQMFGVLFFLIVPILVALIIYFLIRSFKKKQDENIFDKDRVLDATSVVPWVRSMMRDEYSTEVEVRGKRYRNVGINQQITPMMHVHCNAPEAGNYYDIIVSLLEPSAVHSVYPGIHDIDFIDKEMEHLAYAQIIRPKKRIVRTTPEGVETKIEEDITPPDVEEIEEYKNEKTKR